MINRLWAKLFPNRKEFLMYFTFGFLSFLINMGTYAYMDEGLGWAAWLSNLIAWVVSVAFSFVTNKLWVFNVPTRTFWRFMMQMIAFFSARVFTLLVEEAIILIFVTMLDGPSVIVKLFAQIIVVVLNYVISKLLVFRKD